MLEQVWVREQTPGDGTIYIISGFANYNGGVRFFEVFREHVANGGRIVAILGGSTSQRLSSKQIVEELLNCGAEVHLINRKRILHAKCYGAENSDGERLVVTSGNFTGPGMGQNVEAAVILERETTLGMGFSWQSMVDGILSQSWNIYTPTLADMNAPAWQLLYDEYAGTVKLDESEESTMVVLLGHADTARIQAQPGTNAGKGTQYFWLSKDCYDFFPPLTIRNQRGQKATFSCLISMYYMDLQVVDRKCRVTFEAENNLDFRLGTGALRYSGVASNGDLAAITRVSETEYELRIFRSGTPEFQLLRPYAIHDIGHQGKQYGYLSNDEFTHFTGVHVPDTTTTANFAES